MAKNVADDSPWSEYLEKAASPLPDAPAADSMRKVTSLSSKTSIQLEWDKVADEAAKTSGYHLWMALNTRGSEEYVLIMNGTSHPERTEFLVKGLQTGHAYRFKLQALNFNGISEMSQVFTFRACLPPSSLSAPFRVDSTTTSITLGWNAPLDDGGCPITGFEVFRDAGTQGTPTIVVSPPSAAAAPTLRSLVVDLTPAGTADDVPVGNFVRFSVRATSLGGSADSSSYAAIMFAAVPGVPPAAPILRASTSSLLEVELTEFAAAPANGNSLILRYSLEVDDGKAGDFKEFGTPSMVVIHTVEAQRGLTYRLRYRALNAVGWSPYSAVARALAAQPAERPAAPTVLGTPAANSLTIGSEESQDDGGSRITSYELQWSADYQAATPTFTKVADFLETQLLVTSEHLELTIARQEEGGKVFVAVTLQPVAPPSDISLVAGHTYAFRVTATNSKGTSEHSDELVVAAADPIAQPAAPVRTLAKSTRSSLYIDWEPSSATQIPVVGYRLYMSEGTAGDFKLMYSDPLNAL